jgi:CHAT domain-containing protein
MKFHLTSLFVLITILLNAQSFEKAMDYHNNNQDSLALEEFLKCEPVYKAKYGELDTSKYLPTLNKIVSTAYKINNFSIAIEYQKKIVSLYYLIDSSKIEYPNSLIQLGNCYREIPDLENYGFVINKAINSYENNGYKNTYELVEALDHKARWVYFTTYDLEKIIEINNKRLTILKNMGIEQSEQLANVHFRIGAMSNQIGKYTDALVHFKKANEITEAIGKGQTQKNADYLNCVAKVYLGFENNKEAKKYLNKAYEIHQKINVLCDENYAFILLNMAAVALMEDKPQTGINYNLKALKTLSCLGNNYDGLKISILASLAISYGSIDSMPRCINSLKKAENLILKNSLQISPEASLLYSNMGWYYWEIKDYENADKYYSKALDIDTQLPYNDHVEIALAKASLANLKRAQLKIDEANQLYFQIFTTAMKEFTHNFTYIPDNHKRDILNAWKKPFSNAYGYIINKSAPDSLILQGYNVYLNYNQKLLLNNIDNPQIIKQLNTPFLSKIYNDLNEVKSILFDNSTGKIDLPISTLDSLKKIVLSKNFLLGSKLSSNRFSSVNYKNFKNLLKPNEAVLDFFTHYAYDKNENIDTIYYSAFIIKPSCKIVPINLCNNKELNRYTYKTKLYTTEQSPLNQLKDNEYIPNLYAHSNDTNLYSLLWQPIDTLLSGIEKIYICPAGNLFNIAFDAIPTSNTKRLGDKYKFEYISSAAQIALPPDPFYFSDTLSVALFGNMDYNMDTTLISNAALQFASTNVNNSINLERGADLVPLNNAEEIEGINTIFKKRDITPKVFTQHKAIEEAFLKLNGNSTNIIHLSTHAEYNSKVKRQAILSDSVWYETSENPLLRSYLAMSGANNLYKTKNLDVNDGKLTAYEVSLQNLSNTRLATLAACKTGLGEIDDYLGVQGLRRAFKIAGVDYLLVSLWKVADKQTTEMMISFYNNFVNKKMEVRDAFKTAQLEIKKSYPNPYYWAGFVLVY